ncbi:MAG: AzlD domain-containing protein [Spirochaetia bacterium]|nr:AzlD domain-containing protein [Spirochaetia bacterium]
MSRDLIPFILLSAAVTFMPRLIPFLLKGLDSLPPALVRFLRLMPVAALGALIFPGVLIDFQPSVLAGLAGIGISALITYIRGGMIIPILSSILVTFAVIELSVL